MRESGINGYIHDLCKRVQADSNRSKYFATKKYIRKQAVRSLYASDIKYEYGLKIGDSKELLGKYNMRPTEARTKNMNYEDLFYKKHDTEDGYRLRRLVFLDKGEKFQNDLDLFVDEVYKNIKENPESRNKYTFTGD